jgi:hypothetical protein
MVIPVYYNHNYSDGDMKSNRRGFLKITGLAGLGIAGAGFLSGCKPESTRMNGRSQNWQLDPEWQEIKYGAWGGPGVDPRPGPMDQILLKDYAPKTSLVLPESFVPNARFPVLMCIYTIIPKVRTVMLLKTCPGGSKQWMKLV